MLNRKSIVRIGSAMLGTSLAISLASPARAETSYVSPAKAAIVARESAIRTDGQAAIVENMLARASISGVAQPIIFDDALGPKVGAWLTTHGSRDFLAIPIEISGNRVGVAFYDPSTKNLDPYKRVAAVMKRYRGEYIDAMSVDLSSYRSSGLPKPSFEKLDDDQLLALERFSAAVHEVQSNFSEHPTSKEQLDADRVAKSTEAGVLKAARNVYYGQSTKSATHNAVNDVINNAVNKTLRGLIR